MQPRATSEIGSNLTAPTNSSVEGKQLTTLLETLLFFRTLCDMRPPKSDEFPYLVRNGSAAVKIHRAESAKGYSSFYVAHSLNRRRKPKNFADWDSAYEDAKAAGFCPRRGQMKRSWR